MSAVRRRALFDDRVVTTAEVADALGVSVSTIKRWIDQGVLPAERTAGGHRRLVAGDVVRAVRERALPVRDLRVLGARRASEADAAAISAELHDALFAGHALTVRRVIHEAHGSGLPAGGLADLVIAPAMAAIGESWAAGDLDVFHEHRATELVAGALYELKAQLVRRQGRPVAVALGGGVEGDPYVLPNLLAEIVLLEAGWQVVNLGANTPLASFVTAIAEITPRLLWLSFSHLRDPDALVAGYAPLHRTAATHETAIAVGGRALTADVRAALGYTMFGDGLQQFAAFVRTLRRAAS